MTRIVVGLSKNGVKVTVDPENSHTAAHIHETPNLLDLVREVLQQTTVTGDEMAFDYDLGKIVGNNDVVQTTDKDEVFYARRLGRQNYTRFVKNRKLEPTNFITVILHKRTNDYDLWSAWVGRFVPSFPSNEESSPESYKFWENRALAYSNQEIVAKTITTQRPW